MKNRIPQKVVDLYNRVFSTPIMQRIMKNYTYLLSANGLSMVLSILQGALVYRMIGAEGNGLLGAIAAFTSAANKFAAFRIYELVVRYVRLYEERGERQKAAAVYKLAGSFEFLGALVAFGLVVLLAPWGAEFFGKDAELSPYWVIYGSVALITFLFESSRGLLQVFDRFDLEAAVLVAYRVITFIIAGLLFIFGGGFVGVFILIIVGKVIWSFGITGAALWVAQKQWGRGWWRAPFSLLREDFRSLFSFAFSTNISNTISLITKDSESLWISALLGLEAAGYYKLAMDVAGKTKLPITPLSQTTYPELSREVAKKQWANVMDTIKRGSRLAAFYTFPLLAGILIFGRWVMGLLYGPEGVPAYPILLILMIGYGWDNIFFWNRVGLLALNRPMFPTVVNFVGMIIKVSLIFLLVAKYQAYAMAGLLSFYYIFTTGIAAMRVVQDLRQRIRAEEQAA